MAAKRTKLKPKPKRSAAEIAKAMLGGKAATPGKPRAAAKRVTAARPSTAPAVAKPANRVVARPAETVVRPLSEVLEAARDAVAANDLARGLTLLLDAWRAVPATGLAAAIERVGARAQARLEPPTGTTPKERNAAWDKAARSSDPVMRGVLLDSLTATKGSAETLVRIELIVKHRDPRVASRIVDLVEVPVYNASVSRTKPFWKRIFQLLAQLGDPRVLERARGFEAAWDASADLNRAEPPEQKKRLAEVMPALEEAYRDAPALSAEDERRCADVIAAIPVASSDRTEEQLLAEIYAAPDDDQARMVYADWLLERDEPRGEFIVLQLARTRGKLTPEQTRREKSLVAQYGMQWLGPLAKVINKQDLRFERGFLSECQPKVMLDEHPMWATVREVDGEVPASDACRVPSLRVLTNLRRPHIEQLAKLSRPLAVEELSFHGPDYFDFEEAVERDRRLIEAFSNIGVLPALRRLVVLGTLTSPVPLERLQWLLHAPASANLESLELPVDQRELAACLAALTPTKVQRLVVRHENENWGWRITLERDASGALSRLTVLGSGWHMPAYAEAALAGIAELPPPTLTTARVAIPLEESYEQFHARFARALARQHRLVAPAMIEHAKA